MTTVTPPSVSSTRDRLLALEALRQDTSRWSSLKMAYKNDKEFIMLQLANAKQLPDKSDFERLFSDELRMDRDIIISFCHRPDFPHLYSDRLLYVPDSLRDDKQVMLEYCRKIPRSLQECSERLIHDYDVVETAVSLDGMELQYASRSLQSHRALVELACRSNGRALEFCPTGPVRDALTSDRDFMLMVLKSTKQAGPMYRLIKDKHLRADKELLLVALAHGLRWRFCPEELQHNHAFILEAVHRQAALYLELRQQEQLQLEIARAAVTAETAHHTVIVKALAQNPSLQRDTNVVLSMARRGDAAFVKELFMNNQEAFKDNEDVMMAILHKDRTLFPYCSNRLRHHPEIIMTAIDATTALDVITSLTATLLETHPEILIKAIAESAEDNLNKFPTQVRSAAIWTNRNVALAWIRRKCPVRRSFASLLQTDRELALEVAQNCWRDFVRVGTALKADRDFVLQAVDLNGRVLRFASVELRQDFDVAMRAVAQTCHALSTHPGGETVTREALEVYLQDKLALYQTFVYDFLAGICIRRPNVPPALRSPLTLLDRGTETSQALKRNIADFLGVPRGDALALVRRAAHNLAHPTPEDPQDARRDGLDFLNGIPAHLAHPVDFLDDDMEMNINDLIQPALAVDLAVHLRFDGDDDGRLAEGAANDLNVPGRVGRRLVVHRRADDRLAFHRNAARARRILGARAPPAMALPIQMGRGGGEDAPQARDVRPIGAAPEPLANAFNGGFEAMARRLHELGVPLHRAAHHYMNVDREALRRAHRLEAGQRLQQVEIAAADIDDDALFFNAPHQAHDAAYRALVPAPRAIGRNGRHIARPQRPPRRNVPAAGAFEAQLELDRLNELARFQQGLDHLPLVRPLGEVGDDLHEGEPAIAPVRDFMIGGPMDDNLDPFHDMAPERPIHFNRYVAHRMRMGDIPNAPQPPNPVLDAAPRADIAAAAVVDAPHIGRAPRRRSRRYLAARPVPRNGIDGADPHDNALDDPRADLYLYR
ncbi:hypothetical protein MPSEU_001106600 [Mayamaea pseudoterrestris]|nr:hypothetical protein MPSEU_001106600 [Mayamaea pseudoterrestris]